MCDSACFRDRNRCDDFLEEATPTPLCPRAEGSEVEEVARTLEVADSAGRDSDMTPPERSRAVLLGNVGELPTQQLY